MTEPVRRLTLSQVVERLLEERGRAAGERSSVSLTRNAKGHTQVEVTVRTGDDPAMSTASQAAAEARRLYDELCAAYPVAVDPPKGGEPS